MTSEPVAAASSSAGFVSGLSPSVTAEKQTASQRPWPEISRLLPQAPALDAAALGAAGGVVVGAEEAGAGSWVVMARWPCFTQASDLKLAWPFACVASGAPSLFILPIRTPQLSCLLLFPGLSCLTRDAGG